MGMQPPTHSGHGRHTTCFHPSHRQEAHPVLGVAKLMKLTPGTDTPLAKTPITLVLYCTQQQQ